ncbi:MAG: hypothetical protein QNL04_08180 [SAR324 cluster bacterium]|nr:hypothetical protein [SAR324 cluster bacterium]
MRLFLITLILFSFSSELFAAFPVIGPIFDADKSKIGTAEVYPRYVEIYDENHKFVAKAGILVSKGLARVHVVLPSGKRLIAGFAKKGVIYDSNNKMRGTYFWTPTYSYAHTLAGKRVGSTKCIAWPRVCSVGVAAFLLGILKEQPAAEVKDATGAGGLAPKFVAPVPIAVP